MALQQGTTVSPSAPLPLESSATPRTGMVELTICLLIALTLTATCWSVPRPTGDLYVAYAGAIDVLNGKLGNPKAWTVKALGAAGIKTGANDDWSFTNWNKPWINQNWGTHLIYYFAYWSAGQTGILVLKALMLLLIGLFIVLGARQHGTGWPVPIVTAGIIIIAGHAYIDLRPNLMTMLFAPLMYWLLYRTRHNPRRIWLAAGALWLWACVHGGFMLGIGMIWLWTLCWILAEVFRKSNPLPIKLTVCGAMAGALVLAGVGKLAIADPDNLAAYLLVVGTLFSAFLAIYCRMSGGELGLLWHLPAAAMLATLLAGVVNPFGIENLTHPFVVGESGKWREVQEWMPVFSRGPVFYGSVLEIFIAGAFLVAAVTIRSLLRGGGSGPTKTPSPVGGAARQQQVKPSGAVAPLVPKPTILELLGPFWGVGVAIIVFAIPAFQVLGDVDADLKHSQNDIPFYQNKLEQLRYQQPTPELQQAATNYQESIAHSKEVLSGAEGQYTIAFYPLCIFVLLAAAAAYAGLRLVGSLMNGQQKLRPTNASEVGRVLFDLALAAVVIKMGLKARRFCPLAMITLGPLLAVQFQWLFNEIHRQCEKAGWLKALSFDWVRPALPILLGVIVLVPTLSYGLDNLKTYDRNNPSYPPEMSSVLDRMIQNQVYAPGAAEFVNHNHIAGRVLQEWRWEGYLHWLCPQLKLYVGGRAQQAYLEPDYILRSNIAAGCPYEAPEVTTMYLDRLHIPLVIMPWGSGAPENLFNRLQIPGSQWAIIYVDRISVVWANPADANMKSYVDQAIDGKLWYPNADIAALSRAMCISSAYGTAKVTPQERVKALKEASLRMPSPAIYQQIFKSLQDLATPGKNGEPQVLPQNQPAVQDIVNFFQEEDHRLEALYSPGSKAGLSPFELVQIYPARLTLIQILARLNGDTPELRQRLDTVYKEYTASVYRWR